MTVRPVPFGDLWKWDDFETFVLSNSDHQIAQTLFEECSEFSLLVTGLPPKETEGQDLFTDLPPNRTVQDKTVFGLFHQQKLIGILDSFKGYPKEEDWFIGLFLINPAFRRQGIGKHWLAAYQAFARENQVKAVKLGVVEQNEDGRKFWDENGFSVEAIRPSMRFGVKDCVVLLMSKRLM
jgi:GNAT superfamily N-acetyltransferase